MLEAVNDTYSSISVSAISIYRYLREERNEMKISGRITSLIMEMDDLLEVPSKDNLEKALSNTKMILQNIERLRLSGYLNNQQSVSANESGLAFEETLCGYLSNEIRKEEDSKSERERAQIEAARQMAIEEGWISTSALQRRLKIGYAHAGKILDQLENEGVIGTKDGSKPRKCLISTR